SLSHNRVFPSFSEGDIRPGFLSHIQKAFERKGITLFTGGRTKSNGDGFIEAIRQSRMAIVLFSMHYASSTLRLDELVEIMKCRKELGQTVMTIY
ncbi:unnamed protein product, partial [Brassica rapa subsp. trilocularis]